MPRENHPNPDVNWQIIDDDSDTEKRPDKDDDLKQPAGDEGISRPDTDDSIPLPDDQRPVYPVEEPPESDRWPMDDVDDSPKRIAHDGN